MNEKEKEDIMGFQKVVLKTRVKYHFNQVLKSSGLAIIQTLKTVTTFF